MANKICPGFVWNSIMLLMFLIRSRLLWHFYSYSWGCLCNIGYTSETHLKRKSIKISFFHNIRFKCSIGFKFCIEHGSITDIPYCTRPQAFFLGIMTSSNGSKDQGTHPSSALLAICAGNSPVPGEFPAQRPVTRSFVVFFDLRLKNRLSKQSWGWWFETLSCPLWRHCNGMWAMEW